MISKDTLAEAMINETLREVFPHGHPDFLPITLKELQLHSDKNHDYAAGGSPLGNFERVAGILSNYPHLNLGDQRVVALVYMLKQMDAVLWHLNQKVVAKVEGISDRLKDISVYAKIVMCMEAENVEGKGQVPTTRPRPIPTHSSYWRAGVVPDLAPLSAYQDEPTGYEDEPGLSEGIGGYPYD